MDVLALSRLQFAATISFHYLYPPLSIGLALVLVIMEGLWLKTRNPVYHQMARFWTRVFALTFAVGVATGVVMEFEFDTNWATYSRFVGDVFGSALAAEGIFAFFLESGFLAVLLFGWDKVGRKLHFFSTCMVCLGAHFSAIWIVVANSWMQTPAGYHLVGEGLTARAEITDFWAMVFNPSSMARLGHTVCGAWQAGALAVASPPVVVMAFPDRDAMLPYLPLYHGKSLNAAAFFTRGSDENWIVLAFAGANSASSSMETIYHEYTHLLFRQYARLWPLWLTEGTAEVYSTFQTSGRVVRLGGPFVPAMEVLADKGVPSLEELFPVNTESPQYNERERQGSFYAGAWLVTHFLMAGDPAHPTRLSSFLNC